MPRPGQLRVFSGARLRAARRERGVTQTQLADIVGISTQTMSPIEQGRRVPTTELAHALAAALRISLIELVDQDSPRGLSDLRVLAGLTLEEASAQLHWDANTLYSLERGVRTVAVDHVRALAQLYRVDPDDILNAVLCDATWDIEQVRTRLRSSGA